MTTVPDESRAGPVLAESSDLQRARPPPKAVAAGKHRDRDSIDLIQFAPGLQGQLLLNAFQEGTSRRDRMFPLCYTQEI